MGIPLGYLAARKHGSWLDSASVIGSLLGVAIPVFFLAYLLRLVFAVELGWLPGSGRQDVRIDATRITNFYVLDGLLTREWDAAWDAVLHLILPGDRARHDPAGDHRADHPGLGPRRRQRGLRADGEREGPGDGRPCGGGTSSATPCCRCRPRSACRPACCCRAPCSPRPCSPSAASGSALYDALFARDFALLQGFILMLAIMYVLVNLLVDISYGLLDPRVRVR